MVDAEAYDWSSNVGGNVFQFFEPASGNTTNNSNNYSSEVARLKTKFSSIAAVVVSSDPYFRSTASTFAKAIQALGNVPICYPFEDFPLSGHNIKLPGGARLSSKTFTDADTAYYQLGLRAADVLDDPHPNNNNPFKSATWNWNVSMQTGSWAVA
jgi:hypothetical protein